MLDAWSWQYLVSLWAWSWSLPAAPLLPQAASAPRPAELARPSAPCSPCSQAVSRPAVHHPVPSPGPTITELSLVQSSNTVPHD